MKVKLVIAKGNTSVREIPLRGARTVIGRKNDCTLRIPSPLVSRQHCELTRVGSQLVVKDLGSANGTLVNGARVRQKELKSGDRLVIGPITFIVQLVPTASDAAVPVQVVEETGDDADLVVAEVVAEEDEADNADFVLSDDEETPAVDADEAPTERHAEAEPEEADFVLSDDAVEEAETVHDVDMADVIAGAVPEAEPPAAPAEPVEPAPEEPKKKGGLLGRFFGRKRGDAEPAKPASKPPAAETPAPPLPAPPVDESAEPVFVTQDPESKPDTEPQVGDDELADFLINLNEKEE